jgi:hypothetical protein
MVDGSKVSADSYNFMKEIKHETTIKDTKKVTSTKTIGKKKKK